MISFKNKKILVFSTNSSISRDISIQLSELGAKVILVAENEEILKETISLMKGSNHKYFCFDYENLDNLIPNFIEYDGIKFDGYIHCTSGSNNKYTDTNFERNIKINTYTYLQIMKYISQTKYSNDTMSVLYLSSQIVDKNSFMHNASCLIGENIAKELSHEFLERKIRINSLIATNIGNELIISSKEISNMAIFMMSDSAKYIIGETYQIDNNHMLF